GVLAVHLIKRDAPEMATVVIAAAGSFAAIATLLGSPLAGAFLLMEAGGLGGPLMSMVLMPGLLAAGVGSLIYIGMRSRIRCVAITLAQSGFRGGPVSPCMFFGAAVGIALSHLPGLSMMAGAAMGIGAMTVAMLGLPLVALLLVVLFLQVDSVQLTPLVIVAI